MANIANIVLNDAQATPVAHTFAPASVEAGRAVLEDRASGVYIGYNKLTLTLSRPTGQPKSATRNLVLGVKMETPKMETVSSSTVAGIAPAPTVSYRPFAELKVTVPERSVLQDRKDLQKFMREVLANPFVTDMFEKFELPY